MIVTAVALANIRQGPWLVLYFILFYFILFYYLFYLFNLFYFGFRSKIIGNDGMSQYKCSKSRIPQVLFGVMPHFRSGGGGAPNPGKKLIFDSVGLGLTRPKKEIR